MNSKIRYADTFKPYALIFLISILAYLPVSLMVFSLKNDIINIEYPIKFFISESIRHGISPLWFNTWAMGFPLTGILTWNIYNPFELISSLLPSSIYMLHAEFIFYIFFSGCSMYYFLKKHTRLNLQIALLIACCYMLSGFNVGSSQWLLYISACAYLPLVISCLLDLLKNPGWKRSLIFSIVFYTALTGEYVAFSVVLVYLILAITIYFVIVKRTPFLYLVITFIFCSIICFTCLYESLNLLQFMERGQPINGIAHYFDANSVPPVGLLTLFLPFSSVKMFFLNTEGTMIDAYMGLAPLLFFPLACVQSFRRKKKHFIFLITALAFLFISFGSLTPVRSLLNILPGFSYFRNAGLFRLHFIFFILLFLAKSLEGKSFYEWINEKVFKKSLLFTIAPITLVLLASAFIFSGQTLFIFTVKGFQLKEMLHRLSFHDCILISCILQLLFLLLILLSYRYNKKWMLFLLFTDLIINTLICTPIFTVSSFKIPKVQKIVSSSPGFPVQKQFVSLVPGVYKEGEAIWDNTNVYQKKVTAQPTYVGSLYLNNYHAIDSFNKELYAHQPLFSDKTDAKIQLKIFHPDYLLANVISSGNTSIHLLQNYYAGWKANYNGKPVEIKNQNGLINIMVNGSGQLEFKYERKGLLVIIFLTHLFIFSIFFFYAYQKIKPFFKTYQEKIN